MDHTRRRLHLKATPLLNPPLRTKPSSPRLPRRECSKPFTCRHPFTRGVAIQPRTTPIQPESLGIRALSEETPRSLVACGLTRSSRQLRSSAILCFTASKRVVSTSLPSPRSEACWSRVMPRLPRMRESWRDKGWMRGWEGGDEERKGEDVRRAVGGGG